MTVAASDRPDPARRLGRIALYRWWRRSVVGRVDHEAVLARVIEESGWSPRFAFMTMMSAGIAVLGLLLSSPAVVIGAMLISPLMNPILGFGFSLALFDFRELRRSLKALMIGSVAAIAFTALLVLVSPLQAPTAEIVARTRPNLFDLAVALFAALAGTFAIIRGRGDTIVGVLTLVFIVMAIPLGISLNRIGREALATAQTRSLLSDRFGADARVTQLDIDFTARPIVVRAVVITPRRSMQKTRAIQAALAQQLARPVRLNLDQILLGAGADALAAQREELRQAGDATNTAAQHVTDLANSVALITGVAPDAVTIDRDHHRAIAPAAPLPGATVATYRMLERRAAQQSEDWDVAIVPPQGPLPEIVFADGSDTLDADAGDAVATSAWAARRWNVSTLAVPGLPAGAPPANPDLDTRRALAIAAALRQQGVAATPAPAAGRRFALTPASTPAP
jgi:uncharacterized hydrophobic protein (TIGR00271 family)